MNLAPGRGADLSGILITTLSPVGGSSVTTDPSGLIQMDALVPGTCELEVSFVDRLLHVIEDVTVSAGQTTNLGMIVLLPTNEVLIVDGFE